MFIKLFEFLKEHLIEAICHKLLQREAVLSFPSIFKLLNTKLFHHSQHSRGVLGQIGQRPANGALESILAQSFHS